MYSAAHEQSGGDGLHAACEGITTRAERRQSLYFGFDDYSIASPVASLDAAAGGPRGPRRAGPRHGRLAFRPCHGLPFWLDYAKKLGWDPRNEIKAFADLNRLGLFEDDWLRGGPVQRWVPRGLAGKPVFVFETGGTTGTPKTRIACDDFRTDYELFSETLPDEHFPKGGNWLMLGPSGPRRLRLGSSTSRSTGAASASVSISIPAGSSS